MATIDETVVLKRIGDLLALDAQTSQQRWGTIAGELVHGATSIIELLYGANSAQLTTLRNRLSSIEKQETAKARGTVFGVIEICQAVWGVLRSIKAEVEAGLISSLRQQVIGEVLTDFIQLSRAVLEQPGDGAKNVAAVLAAAAFEDTIRRMGASFAGVLGRDDLQDVLTKLKETGIIQGPQVGIAQSYLSFRNHALHANWDKIDRAAVQSVLAFVQELLLKHYR